MIELKCVYCESPVTGIAGSLILKNESHDAICASCIEVEVTMNATNGRRQQELDGRLKRLVSNAFGNSSTWKIPTDGYRDQAPTWAEFRDSLMRAIFELEREDKALEIHAEYVKENCL